MNLHWEKFGTTLSQWWRFFGPPILNASFLIVLFNGLIVKAATSVSKWIETISPAAYQFFEGALNLFSGESTITDLMTQAKSFFSVAGVAFVVVVVGVSAIVVAIDALTRFLGRLVPFKLRTDDDALLCRHEVQGLLPETLQRTDEATDNGHDRYIHWLTAKAKLDASDRFMEYRERRNQIKGSISDSTRNVAYIKAYVLLTFLSLFPDEQTMWPWMFLGLVAILSVWFLYEWGRRFHLCLDLVRNDLETYLAEETAKLPAAPEKAVQVKQPVWSACVYPAWTAQLALMRDTWVGRFWHGIRTAEWTKSS